MDSERPVTRDSEWSTWNRRKGGAVRRQGGSNWQSDENRWRVRDRLRWRLQRHLRRLVYSTVVADLDTAITGPIDGVPDREMDHLLVELVYEVAEGFSDGVIISGLITDGVVDSIFARAVDKIGRSAEGQRMSAQDVDGIVNASLDEVIMRLTQAYEEGGYLGLACGHVLEGLRRRMGDAAA